MKITNHVAIAALLSCSVMTPAPAFAATVPISNVPQQSDAADYCSKQVTGDTNISTATTLGARQEGTDYAETNVADIETTRKPDLNGGFGDAISGIASGSEYRNGGSPNIFGLQNFSRTYRNSVVDQSYDWSRTDTYAFTCNSFRWEVVDHETVTDPTAGDFPGLGECTGKPGNNTGAGQTNSSVKSRCKRGTETVIDIYGWVPNDSTNNVFSYEASGSDTHSQVASTVDVSFLNQQVSVVVCITPALPKKGVTGNAGDWVKQNQYNGSKCNTAGFYSLDGIPAPIPSNSLPTI
jgi:hypothetical protein